MTILEFKREVFKLNEIVCRWTLGTIQITEEFKKYSSIEEFFLNSPMAVETLKSVTEVGWTNDGVCTPEMMGKVKELSTGTGGGGAWHWHNAATGGWPRS